MKTLIVTGGAGFIGSNFLHLLRVSRPEWKLVNLDALTYAGNLENLVEFEGAANYRFVERAGHVMGPVVMSSLFAVFGQNWNLLCWVAGGVTLFGLIFLTTTRSMSVPDYKAEISK